MDPSGVFGEDESRFTDPQTVSFVPSSQGIQFIKPEVSVDLIKVKVPFEFLSSDLFKVITEDLSPFTIFNIFSQPSFNLASANTIQGDLMKEFNILSELSEWFHISLVHGGCVKTNITCNSVVMVATNSQSQLSTKTMTSKTGG